MGLASFDELGPHHVMQRIDPARTMTYEDLFTWLDDEELLHGSPAKEWAVHYERANPHSFRCDPPLSQARRSSHPKSAYRTTGKGLPT